MRSGLGKYMAKDVAWKKKKKKEEISRCSHVLNWRHPFEHFGS
jgi:hypothetical protein